MLANRFSLIGDSQTLALNAKVKQMVRQGIDMVSFAVGEPDFDTPAHIIQAAKDALDSGKTHYTPSKGIPELRQAIADKSVSENNIPCTADNVIVCPTKFGVFASIYALANPGDEVILPDPGWVSYEPMTHFPEATPVFADLNASDAVEQVKGAVTPKTKVLVLNTPTNPGGVVVSRETIKGIADLAVDHDFYVVSDEVYEKIIFEGEHVSMAGLPGMFERAVTVNGFSKAYAMTGWRLGWVCAPAPILMGIGKVQAHTITHCTSFVQHAGVAALGGDQTPLENMRQEFARRRKIVMEELDKIPFFSYDVPKGAFYIFPGWQHEISSQELCDKLCDEAHVGATPGSAFGANGERHLRISYATSEERIREGLGRIREYVGKL